MPSIHLHLNLLLSEGQAGEAWKHLSTATRLVLRLVHFWVDIYLVGCLQMNIPAMLRNAELSVACFCSLVCILNPNCLDTGV
jgi:hypothetical protein